MQSVVPPDGKTSTRKASMDESNTLVANSCARERCSRRFGIDM